MFLKKIKQGTSGHHVTHKVSNKWLFQSYFKKLTYIKKWFAGRNKKHIVFWTRKSLKYKNRLSIINFNCKYKKIAIINNIKNIKKNNRMLSLLQFSNNSFTYILSTEYHKIFNYIFLSYQPKLKKYFFKHNFIFLFNLKKKTLINSLETKFNKKTQYCKSTGSNGKIINFNRENFLVNIQLPSKSKKMFSIYSITSIGKTLPFFKKKMRNTKAGYWRNFGYKSIVRGVAMNPVDHPHGGRTKSIKYPKTPWGKTTKYK